MSNLVYELHSSIYETFDILRIFHSGLDSGDWFLWKNLEYI